MLRRLERDATMADIAAVEALLGARTAEEDPVGHMQFIRRLADLMRRLEEIEAAPYTTAEVALFFGGRPVVGSMGFLRSLGRRSSPSFRHWCQARLLRKGVRFGARGPVPQRDRTQLLLTDFARGSFGFILRQAEDPQLVDSAMKDVVGHSVDLIVRLTSRDEETFENLAEDVDNRVLNSLRSLFKVVDDAGATMKIVEHSREITLRREDIGLARERTENASLVEREEQRRGTIYILPASRRFELHPESGGEALRGVIAPECLQLLTGGGTEVRAGLIGTVVTVQLGDGRSKVLVANRAPAIRSCR